MGLTHHGPPGANPGTTHPIALHLMCYVYIRTEKEEFWTDDQGNELYTPGLFTVGFYAPGGIFQPESDYNSSDAAAQRVHFLNGGH